MPKNKCPVCNKRANFGFAKTDEQLYCSKDKMDGMIDVKSKRCIEDNCTKQPHFNKQGEAKALYCSDHKKDKMIDVKHKRCIKDNCTKRPNFNKAGETKALYCSDHKNNKMIDVKSKRCIENNCTKIPNFNEQGETKALYCSDHKKDGMIDVKSKRCIEDNCTKRPTFNKQGETKALYCSEHKKDKMIDVKSKRCIKDNCTKRPTYNKAGETKVLYCSDHKKDDMVDVKHKQCVLCKMIQSKKKYDWYCFGCYCYTFPDKAIVRNHKTKENQIMADLSKVYPNIVRDSRISGGCSKRRPDGLIQLDDYNIIIEIDENQHNSVGYSCENKRIMEIFQDLGNSPLTVIRFNPDKFAKEQSLFMTTKATGELRIRNQKKYDAELAKLVEVIKFHIATRPDSEINSILLRYD